MSSVLLQRLRFYAVLFASLSVIGFILLPPGMFSGTRRHNARRASCQSNLKQIGLAVRLYTQDYDDRLPQQQWAVLLSSYSKYTELREVLGCAETNRTEGTSDYFWNAHSFGTPLSTIKSPTTLILAGDGRDDAPLNASLSQFPEPWREDERSPAWRHLDSGNYAFADGHVKWLKAKNVSRDFRWRK